VRVVRRDEITAVVNTGDDTSLHGLHISPDLDTVAYTLAGRNDDERGWGLAGETWAVMEALEELGGESWFRLGDRDLATHLYRTQRLSEGASLSAVTKELARALGVGVRLLPMSDDPVRTRLRLTGKGEVAFQEYFVRLHHEVPVEAVRFEGAEAAVAAPGVIEAIEQAEVVVVCPSNPVLSIGPILAVPGIADVLAGRRDHVVAVSPIIAGAALKGPADRLLVELGEEASVVGVARRYTAVAGTLVIDEADARRAADVEKLGIRCVVAPIIMDGVKRAAELARVVLEAGRADPPPAGVEPPGAEVAR
ncbi:MAG: 2-phospho-L-lactate transferase, partial [Acidimicrobiales bacterium]